MGNSKRVLRRSISFRPVGRRGSRGFARTHLLTSKKFYIHRLTVYFLSVLPFESGPLVSLQLRIIAVQTSLVAMQLCEFARAGTARNARESCLRRGDERTCVNTCVNKSLVHALESCPSSATCCSANLSTFSHGNSMLAGLVNGCNTPRAM